MATDAGAQTPDAPAGDDPRAGAALVELRRLLAGRRGDPPGIRAPDEVDEVAPKVPVPAWVGLGDRARARWLRQPPGLRAGVAVLAVLLAVGACWWLVRTPPLPAEATLPVVEASPTSWRAESAVTPSTVVTHAAGAVREPGIAVLPAGSRVVDLLEAVGGATAEADLDRLNLAAPLTDGERVYVPVHGEPALAPIGPAGAGPAAPQQGPLDLNVVGVEALEQLPGVGPATAAAIVAHRDENGPFSSVDDLLAVRGIGPAKLEAIAPLVAVSG